MKLALVTLDVYAAGMRLFCEVRAARWLLPSFPWRLSSFGLVRLVPLVVLVSSPDLVVAQQGVLDAPPPAPPLTEQDERKPPSATAARGPAAGAVRSAAGDASGSVERNKAAVSGRRDAGKSGDAERGTGKAAADGGDAVKSAAASGGALRAGAVPGGAKAAGVSGGASRVGGGAADGGGAAKAAARSGGASAVGAVEAGAADGGEAPDDVQEAAGAPPPPVVDGDFAGPGAVAASSAEFAVPQDDFAAEAQEYVRPQKREYSVRIDLLNWLLLGRLSVELEMSVWKYLTVSLTPVFVVARSPIAINYAGLDDGLTQRSHGIGPLSGVSLGVGAWFWGEPFKGYVLRLEFTNYSYSYRTTDASGPLDRVDFTERRLILFIGSHSRFGAFTFAGGFGLGYELNQQTRCGLTYDEDDGVRSRADDCKGKQQIALDRQNQERSNLNGPLHPVYFQARFSIGVVF